MKSSDELMLIPHNEGFRAWRARGQTLTQLGSESKGGVDWVALPARAVVSVPIRFNGVDAARREGAVQLELEAAGLANEVAQPYNFDLVPLSDDERDQRTTSFIQMAGLPQTVLEDATDARFAPSVVFRKLQPGEVLIWRENGGHVMAVPYDNGKPLHFQALTARTLDADAAAELRCILASLELSGLSPNIQSICVLVSKEDEATLPVSFENALDIPLVTRPEGAPTTPLVETRLIPEPVVQYRYERQQRRLMLMGAFAFAFVLVAALAAFGARVALRERAIAKEEQQLRELEPQLAAIRDARAAWEDLASAITPDYYPVEAMYQLIRLLPDEHIRITRFEAREDGMVIDGQASTLSRAIEFRDSLTNAPAFARWSWNFAPPTSLPNGQATFRAEGHQFSSDDENENMVGGNL